MNSCKNWRKLNDDELEQVIGGNGPEPMPSGGLSPNRMCSESYNKAYSSCPVEEGLRQTYAQWGDCATCDYGPNGIAKKIR